jgi:hypothetical protein
MDESMYRFQLSICGFKKRNTENVCSKLKAFRKAKEMCINDE